MAEAVKTPPVEDQHTARAKALINKLWGDQTEAGQAVRKAAKEMFPDVTIPEDQAALAVAPVKAEVDGLKKQLTDALDRIAARDKADDDMRAENALAVKVNSARQEFGLTDAGFSKMLDRMKETGNTADPQAAAAWVMSQMPKPEPTTTPTWLPEAANLFGVQKKDEQFAALHQNPQKYMDDQLREFVRDPDKYVSETFGRA